MTTIARKLAAHVTMLTGLGERSTRYPEALARAADGLAARFADLEYEVKEHAFAAGGVVCKNLEAVARGFSAR